jgi:hypothetical protein
MVKRILAFGWISLLSFDFFTRFENQAEIPGRFSG